MWISRQLVKEQSEQSVQCARVTLNSNGELEAAASGIERGVNMCVPYGYNCSMPAGTNMLLTHCDGEQTAIGAIMSSEKLNQGEIKISSEGGAFIYLKNNGSVVINGLEIDRNGVIVND